MLFCSSNNHIFLQPLSWLPFILSCVLAEVVIYVFFIVFFIFLVDWLIFMVLVQFMMTGTMYSLAFLYLWREFFFSIQWFCSFPWLRKCKMMPASAIFLVISLVWFVLPRFVYFQSKWHVKVIFVSFGFSLVYF